MDTSLADRLTELELRMTKWPDAAPTDVAVAIDYLGKVRTGAGGQWAQVVKEQIQPHSLLNLIRQCPLTGRCASRPRGYAGDAVMIDYIYGITPPPRLPGSARLQKRCSDIPLRRRLDVPCGTAGTGWRI